MAVMADVPGFMIQNDSTTSEFTKFVNTVMDISNAEGKQHFTAYRCIKLNSQTWLNMARDRLYVIFVSDTVGGQSGLDQIVSTLVDVSTYRSHFKPHSVKELLSHTEAARTVPRVVGQQVVGS